MENKVAMKFSLNETYKVKLAFDEPHISDGQFGKSYMYGGWIDNNEVRFFASAGLHAEIQAQKLGKASMCEIKKVKPGDFAYFIVNGKSKHLDSTSSPTYETTAPNPNNNELEARVKSLENWKTEVEKKLSSKSEEIPF